MTWLEALQSRAEMTSLAVVAHEIGYSKATISRVLNGCYGGAIEAVKNAVKCKYLNNLVECPLLGEIESSTCQSHQCRPFAATNPMRVQLHHACKTCPNRKEKDHDLY